MDPNSNISQKDFELTERYFEGSMSENEITEFEDRLKKESELEQHLKEQRILLHAIEEQSLKNKLDNFHEEATSSIRILNPQETQNRSSFYSKLAIAASLAIIIGVGGFFLINQPNATEKVFATHFKPDPGLATTMGTSSQYDFYEAMVDYKQENYIKALKKWKALLINNPKNDTLNYFVGVTHLANDNENSAIKYLIPVSQNKTSVFYKDAQLYLGFAYLKAKNIALAKKYFTLNDTKISQEILTDLEN